MTMAYTEPDPIDTMLERWIELSDSGVEPKAIMRTMSDEYPEMTCAMFSELSTRLMAFYRERIAATKDHAAFMKEVSDLCAPVWRGHPERTMGECLDILISQGNERAKIVKPIIMAMPPVRLA